jgi:NAD(P)-dependent dehydrogenase (short-subunit alcohol dehydrogenase family)
VKLADRIALVTGAGRLRGIGRAAALRLAQEGASVVVSSLPRDPGAFARQETITGWHGAASVAAEIISLGGKAISVDCDVTAPDQVSNLFQSAERAFGTPDAIVNNAGVAGEAGANPIIDLDDAIWHRAIDVNLNGTYYVCKAAARALRAAEKKGSIVNIASLAGRVGMAGYGGYCASKFGVIGLTQQLALELARYGIRINAICPGSVDTDMMDGTFNRIAARSRKTDFAALKESVAHSIPLRRQGSVEEQAAAIAFLLGPDASYITGQAINVDGGVRFD